MLYTSYNTVWKWSKHPHNRSMNTLFRLYTIWIYIAALKYIYSTPKYTINKPLVRDYKRSSYCNSNTSLVSIRAWNRWDNRFGIINALSLSAQIYCWLWKIFEIKTFISAHRSLCPAVYYVYVIVLHTMPLWKFKR